jgi:hypothetical protein
MIVEGEEPSDGGGSAGGPEAGRIGLQAYQPQPRPGAGPRIQAMLDSKNFLLQFSLPEINIAAMR